MKFVPTRRMVIHAPHLQPKTPTPEIKREAPSALTKAQRLSRELWRWARQGAPIAPREQRKARQAACEACPYYRATGNAGFGECGAPGCGCTRAKTWLLTAQCPHPEGSRWD